ncbi:MAG TPA: hypothetical protein ENJ84_03505 [Gammaproteobacteria bacterium]|nr:hypothetical protein [Gammaproteobacteria bacterium]
MVSSCLIILLIIIYHNNRFNALPEIYRGETFGFPDALILTSHETRQCLLYTFDKMLAKYTQARNLEQITQ